jgi:hypothetical protein
MSVRLFSGVALAAALTCTAAQQDATLPQRFTAFAASPGGPRTSAVATQIEISVTRWSTDEEAQQIIDILKERGPEALLDVLRNMKSVGRINTPGNLAYDLRYAQQETRPDGGRRIMLATDRPISYWEAVNRPLSIHYPFTFIELRLDGKGEGEGKLNLATQVRLSSDGKMLELTNYDTQPIQLNQVKRAG